MVIFQNVCKGKYERKYFAKILEYYQRCIIFTKNFVWFDLVRKYFFLESLKAARNIPIS